MWNRIDLKTRGKAAFRKNYWSCVAVAFIMTLVSGAVSGSSGIQNRYQDSDLVYYEDHSEMMLFLTIMLAVFALIAMFAVVFGVFVGNILQIGGCKFFIQNQTGQERVSTIFAPFKSGHYGNQVLTMFLMNLYIALWSLLLFVPGIIKSYEYRMIPYILAENPGMDRKEAFAISKRMMDGKKWDTFVLDLSFIGWWILSALTCGILAIFYVAPYQMATNAELYTENRAIAFQEGYIR